MNSSSKCLTRLVATMLIFVLGTAIVLAADPPQAVSVATLELAIVRLRPLHTKISAPGPTDWLAQHAEAGESFAQYLARRPVTPQGKRKIIYIQPIGEFTDAQQKVVTLTTDYMGRFFNLEVKVNPPLPIAEIPRRARRIHPAWGNPQILTTYVLDQVLKPQLPADAAAFLALTASDLWPGEGWNFVFGQASIRERVGIWSINRNGDPGEGEEGFKLCLVRTIKTAVHETGHMFSMHHCTAYECVMCGSNSLEESDRKPLHLCPECLAKVCWATQADPVARYQRLMSFCQENGIDQERAFFETSIEALQEVKP